MKKLHLFSMLLPLCFFTNARAQDLLFSQFYEQAIYRNPALAGVFSGDYRIGINYREQGLGSEYIIYKTGIFTAETKIRLKHSADYSDYVSIGIGAELDNSGSAGLKSYNLLAIVNYNKCLSDQRHSYISTGLGGGYTTRFIDAGKASFGSQVTGGVYNPQNASNETFAGNAIKYYDVCAGVSFNTSLDDDFKSSLYLGVAGYHLNTPDNKIYEDTKLNRRLLGNAGLSILLSDNLRASFHADYQVQYPHNFLLMGAMLGWHGTNNTNAAPVYLSGGIFYRYNRAIIPLVKLNYRAYGLAFSYDIPVKGSEMQAFETTFYIKGIFKDTPPNRYYCPRFDQMINPHDLMYR